MVLNNSNNYNSVFIYVMKIIYAQISVQTNDFNVLIVVGKETDAELIFAGRQEHQ